MELSHADTEVLQRAAATVARQLRQYEGVFDIDDGFSLGKVQLDFRLKPAARALGLTASDMAQQVRASFFGVEVVREQRGRDEVRVYVRPPRAERTSEFSVDNLVLRTPRGGEVALRDAAHVSRGRSPTEISRRAGRRVVAVRADVDTTVGNASKILGDLQQDVVPDLVAEYGGLRVSFEGEQASQRASIAALGRGFVFSLLGIYALLAIVFRSYAQPLVVMFVIPFGLVGALVGHVLMGYSLSLLSVMGVVALSGVVVNDSLLLVAAINEHRSRGVDICEAIVSAAVRRARPIVLTSLTTFVGLVPMILETSAQARFLIPMAISLGFGVLFATPICLLLVPSVYAALLDLQRLGGGTRR